MSRKKSHTILSDEELKDQLSNLEVPYDENSWPFLADKWFDFQTDQLIKNKIGQHESTYNNETWPLLQQKMKALSDIKYKLLNQKSLELLLIVIALSLVTFSDWKQIVVPGKNTKVTTDTQPEKNYDQKPSITAIDDFVLSDISLAPSTTQEGNKDLPDEFLADNRNPIVSTKTISAGRSNEANLGSKNNRPLPLYLVDKPELTTVSPIKDKESLTVLPYTTQSSIRVNQLNTPSGLLLDSKVFSQGENTNMVSAINRLIPLTAKTDQKKNSLWLGLTFGYDRDLVRTPFPTQLSALQLGRVESNFHAEISLSYQMKFIEFQTGMTFLYKSYKSAYEGINDAIVISIPANIKVQLSQNGFMRAYLLAGVSGHFVSHANYRETDYFIENPEFFYRENNYRVRGDKGLLSLKDFDNGILEGESLKGNSFVTLNMGIGFDVPLTSTSSLFIEQVYFHHLSGGIGPAFDNISSFSTRIGARYMIYR